jgi:hypothetical protein
VSGTIHLYLVMDDAVLCSFLRSKDLLCYSHRGYSSRRALDIGL